MSRRTRQHSGFGFRPTGGLVVALLLTALAPRAQEVQPYQLKAAFLYHFAQLVNWPSTAFRETNSPMVIAVLGENPFGSQLEQAIDGKNVNGHRLAVRELRSVQEATNACHILFISSSEKKSLAAVFASLHGLNVLTVGETDHFTEDGGMIGFMLEGTKIRFQINNAAAKSAGLKISSRLLSLASNRPQ